MPRSPLHAEMKVSPKVDNETAEKDWFTARHGHECQIGGVEADSDRERDRAQRWLCQRVRQLNHKEGVVGKDLCPTQPEQFSCVSRSHRHQWSPLCIKDKTRASHSAPWKVASNAWPRKEANSPRGGLSLAK